MKDSNRIAISELITNLVESTNIIVDFYPTGMYIVPRLHPCARVQVQNHIPFDYFMAHSSIRSGSPQPQYSFPAFSWRYSTAETEFGTIFFVVMVGARTKGGGTHQCIVSMMLVVVVLRSSRTSSCFQNEEVFFLHVRKLKQDY